MVLGRPGAWLSATFHGRQSQGRSRRSPDGDTCPSQRRQGAAACAAAFYGDIDDRRRGHTRRSGRRAGRCLVIDHRRPDVLGRLDSCTLDQPAGRVPVCRQRNVVGNSDLDLALHGDASRCSGTVKHVYSVTVIKNNYKNTPFV